MKLLRALRSSCFNIYHRALHIREELAFWKAKQMALMDFRKKPVRHFIVPTPEGILRILTWKEVCQLRGDVFPRRFKIADLYRISFWWTAASRKPIHGNSLPKRWVNKDSLYKWWYMTHSH